MDVINSISKVLFILLWIIIGINVIVYEFWGNGIVKYVNEN